MLRTRLVLAGALALALASCAGIIYLQHRMRTSENARISVMRIENRLNQLQGPPWQVMNPGYGTVKQIRAQVAAEERQLRASLAALRSDAGVPELGGLAASLEQNFASLDLIMTLGIKEGWRNIAHTNAAAQQENVSLAAATKALDAANAAYASRAQFASRTAAGGAAFAIFVLFGAFAYFFLRSHRARRRLEVALARLSQAQRERSKLLARTVEVAEHERIRVATDLHDGPIQHLTALALTIDRLAGRIDSGAPDTVHRMVADVRSSLSREMDALRRLMVELRPPVLGQLGLAAALSDAAQTVFADEDVVWDVRCDIDGQPLAPEVETAIYRVVREALVNVRKHAGASRVDVAVEVVDGSLRVTVADDGKGFATVSPIRDGLPTGHGYGLMGIHERIEGLGGVARIEGRPGRGVVVEATLPLNRQLEDEEEAQRELAVA
jgi:signal transduction histidine kinase